MVNNNVKRKKLFNPIFWFFSIPPIYWLIFFFILPILLLWIYSFGTTNNKYGVDFTWTLANYKQTLQPIYLWLVVKSIIFSAISTIICLVIGFFMAIFIAFTDPKWKPFWLIMIILPFWTNILIRVFGLVSILSNSGIINNTIKYFFIKIQSIEQLLNIKILSVDFFTPFDLMYNYTAVVIGMVYISLPFMLLPIYGALDKLDSNYLEASLDLGANHFQTIVKVMIPMIKPGIKTGIFITFIPNLSTFLIPDMLGGPNAEMIANVIQRQFGSGANWPFGSALAFILMYITFFLILLKSITNRSRLKK